MDWERMREQLESVLNAPMQIGTIPETEWIKLASTQRGETEGVVKSIIRDHELCFALAKSQGELTILRVSEVYLTKSERQLVELMVESKGFSEQKQVTSYLSDEERRANLLREWLLQQLESGLSTELPDTLLSQSSFYATKVPLLLYGDYSPNRRVTYSDLKKLLESFFEAEITLIPLMEKEWLILASESLLVGGVEEREGDEEDSLEQTLDAFGSGLYEMLANEWVGECHLAVHYPMKPAKAIVATVRELRDTINLGRTFHVGSYIHLPWALYLEKLLHMVQDEGKVEFLDTVLRGTDHVLDNETLMTLDHFFALDCNVSETAKKLYIHRNTLLYRLDKFKNETGLDVRTFNHAVLVRLALLLYKVTKRK
jgi:sugar diacid utilization regulator